LNTLYHNIHQEIIDKCREGDSKAQFQLYKLYYKAMYNTSYRIVNDSMEAEDIMQDSFLAAFDKISTYSGKVSFGAWLKKIVINNSLDSIKKNKIEVENIEERNHNIKEEDDDDETEDIDYKIEEIRMAINELADGYRIILSLYLIEGYDHEEIGEILGITSSTSRSQLTRAKKKLKEYLETKSVKI